MSESNVISFLRKNKKKREHSQSSSSSSSSSFVYHEEDAEIKAKGFSKIQQGLREYGEPAERGRARGGFVSFGWYGITKMIVYCCGT